MVNWTVNKIINPSYDSVYIYALLHSHLYVNEWSIKLTVI